jgi:autotransporter passenger strand-loop-strand repeat protein
MAARRLLRGTRADHRRPSLARTVGSTADRIGAPSPAYRAFNRDFACAPVDDCRAPDESSQRLDKNLGSRWGFASQCERDPRGGEWKLHMSVVSSGQTSSGITVSSGLLTVDKGGTALDITVAGGGVVEVQSGGKASGDLIRSGGDQTISAGAGASGTIIYSGGKEDVFGSSLSAVISRGGYQEITFGGVASGAIVHSGGFQELGEIFGLEITSGLVGGSSVDTFVSGGEQIVDGGSTATNTHLLSGGVQWVGDTPDRIELKNDVAIGSVVGSGATATTFKLISSATIYENGKIFETDVISGAKEVTSYGSADAALDGYVVSKTQSGDEVTRIIREPGGGLYSSVTKIGYINLGGVLSATTVESGGTIQYDGGTTQGLVLDAGATEVIGGAYRGVVFTVDNGPVVLSGGEVASGVTEIVASGGVDKAGTVLAGAKEYVSSAGLASGTRIRDGGVLVVSSGGRSVGDTVSSGGRETISAGAAASGGEVLAGGVLSGAGSVGGAVLDYGAVDGASVASGANLTVESGASATGVAVQHGGEVIDDGEMRFAGAGALDGTLKGSGLLVQAAAGDLVLSGSGATFDGKAVISGGTLELATSGALGKGGVSFEEPAAGSAVLQIDAADAPAAGGTFANRIDDFSGAHEEIDLRSIAFVSGAKAKVVGSTLVLTDGGKSYSFDIGGSVAGAYAVVSDGHGGTLIDPHAALFAQTAAAFAPSDAASTALVSSPSPADHTPFLHAAGSATAARP